MDHQVRVFLACRPLIQAHIRSLVREAKLKLDPDQGHGAGRVVVASAEYYDWIFSKKRT